MEWGNGMEDPKIFDLKELDTDQWCKSLKDAGMKMVILTVKHHDGFVLWQSRYTDHGIMSTNFRNGKGDILQDLFQILSEIRFETWTIPITCRSVSDRKSKRALW